MKPEDDRERMVLIQRTLDQLEHVHLSGSLSTAHIRKHCVSAGLDVSDSQIQQALVDAQSQAVAPNASKPSSRRRFTWSSVRRGLWRFAQTDTVIGLVAVMAFFKAAHMAYGAAFLALLATQQFSSLMLMAYAMVMGITLAVGAANTSTSGEVLGRYWSSLWLPLRMTVTVGFLLMPGLPGPAHQPINLIAWLALHWLGA